MQRLQNSDPDRIRLRPIYLARETELTYIIIATNPIPTIISNTPRRLDESLELLVAVGGGTKAGIDDPLPELVVETD
jgi:hypothetical protein